MLMIQYFFRGGADEKLRKWILNEFRIDAVISLPAGLLKPYSGIKTSLLCISRKDPADEVWFIQNSGVDKALENTVEAEKRRELLATLLNVRRGRMKEQASYKINRIIKDTSQELSNDRFNERSPINAAINLFLLFSLGFTNEELKKELPEFDPEFAPGRKVNVVELKRRNHELVPKVSGEDVLLNALNEIEQSAPEFKIVKLEEIANIFSGRSVGRENQTEDSSTQTAIPFIRVSDVNTGRITSPHRSLNAGIKDRFKKRDYLKTKDILLTATGTIGKIAMVPQEYENALASQGVIIVRPSQSVWPPYLMRLLESETYQRLMNGLASGITIQHLKISTIRKILIPLPDLDTQRKLEFAIPQKGGAEVFLSLFRDKKQIEPLLEILYEQGAELRQVRNQFIHSTNIQEISSLIKDVVTRFFQSIKNESVKTQGWSRDISVWLENCKQIGESLLYALSTENGAERFALLESLRADKHKLNPFDQSSDAIIKLADSLKFLFEQLLLQERSLLINDIRLSARLNPSVVDLNDSSNVGLIIRNEGPISIRAVELQTPYTDQNERIVALSPGEEKECLLLIPAKELGVHTLDISCRITLIDGTISQTNFDLAYQVQLSSDSTQKQLEGSPYIAGPPIKSLERPEMFKGREDVLGKIRQSLSKQGASTVLVMIGNRRFGKSSILDRLSLPGILPESWMTAYWSFQDASGSHIAEGVDTNEIYYNISRVLVLAVLKKGYKLHIGGVGDVELDDIAHIQGIKKIPKGEILTKISNHYQSDQAYRRLENQIEAIQSTIYPKRILLMLDEFDKLQQGIVSGVTSPLIPENLRALFHKFVSLSALFLRIASHS